MKKYKLFHIATIFIYAITVSLITIAKDCNLPVIKSNETQETNSYSDKLNYNSFLTVYIDDEVINPPKESDEVEQFLEKIKNTIMNKAGDTTVFKYGDELQLKLKLPYLGIGRNGVVFSIINDDQTSTKVFKLNVLRGNKGLTVSQKETVNYPFWNKAAKDNTFSVAKLYDYDSLGLYQIKEKNNGISLTKFLLDKGLIFIKNDNNATYCFSLQSENIQDNQVKKVAIALADLLQLIRQNPSNSITISPNNIFIEFENNTKCIKKIELIEYGNAIRRFDIYNQIETFDQYLELATYKLNKYLVNNKL